MSATTAEFLDALQERFDAEKTADWASPYKRTTREYAARQALMAVVDLKCKIALFDRIVSEGGVSRD